MDTEIRKQRKDRGSYYTDQQVVEFLVRWAVCSDDCVVMDPSCGDGRFLISSAQHGATRLLGVDVDSTAIGQTQKRLRDAAVGTSLIESDFFQTEPDSQAPVDVALGNPPFIRYQKFNGESRNAALQSALRAGVRLTRLSSTWAPFLLHAMQFLRPGGAMAFVVPAEIVQTQYGLRTLRAMCDNFATVSLVTFEQNFFDEAQTETYLLLTDGYQGSCPSINLLPLRSIVDLVGLDWSRKNVRSDNALQIPADGDSRFLEAFLSAEERRVWVRVRSLSEVTRISQLGVLTNGYVTGANDFFIRTKATALSSGIPEDWLRPTVRNAASLRGLDFSPHDISSLESMDQSHHLICPPNDDLFLKNPGPLQRLIEAGEEAGIHKRFKCRVRQPWWQVPGVQVPDLFLPYMIGQAPISSVNRAGATYTNTLHGLRTAGDVDPYAVAIGLHSTLALLSMELEGRSYGGGVLKLEPREMGRVQVALPRISDQDIQTKCLSI